MIDYNIGKKKPKKFIYIKNKNIEKSKKLRTTQKHTLLKTKSKRLINYLKVFKQKRKNFNRRHRLARSGIIRILCNKRNIFCTLSSAKGIMRKTVSSGLLKVKGRKRQAQYHVKATGQLIINYLFKERITKLILIHKGKAYRKKKKTLLKTFSKVKKFNFIKLQRPAPRSHNGCRPSKKRRK